MRSRQIRTKQNLLSIGNGHIELGGWLAGRDTYLWFGMNGRCIGALQGRRLYRLAKAIVRHFEAASAFGVKQDREG